LYTSVRKKKPQFVNHDFAVWLGGKEVVGERGHDTHDIYTDGLVELTMDIAVSCGLAVGAHNAVN
jgi:hypothetical protein